MYGDVDVCLSVTDEIRSESAINQIKNLYEMVEKVFYFNKFSNPFVLGTLTVVNGGGYVLSKHQGWNTMSL